MPSNSKLYASTYYKENKERLKQLSSAKDYCDLCEVHYSHSHKSKHETSRLHTKLLKMQETKNTKVEEVMKGIDLMVDANIDPKNFEK